ncbi:GNAT family N-acetyltransferase [Sodalis ligni]|uniref:Ribosomal protein S18 acetylase RimI-like enzyme n=1 Tax=Sodalis ligni TaxID=2697027 RepID=A0A4R1N7B8_9GAMM|nr:GNAT family N-acetyltransferase [Sodalis ligni]TCL03165.1 ribosomal protein S18 acetylase RimI-like enzyme [Sodalis ligni]
MFYMAEIKDVDTIAEIVRETITSVYPKYYPDGVVEFFLNYHSADSIRDAVDAGGVYILTVQGKAVATGSIKDNEICRLFVLPLFQGKGLGSYMMDKLETLVFGYSKEIRLDASLPACGMYLKRGYKPVSFESVLTTYDHRLCYLILKKQKITGPATNETGSEIYCGTRPKTKSRQF